MQNRIANKLGRLTGELLFSVLLGLLFIGAATLFYRWAVSASKPKHDIVEIPVRNRTPYTIFISFSSSSGANWPGGSYVWRLDSGQTTTFSLQGPQGDAIFYSAWAGENPSIQWGNSCKNKNGQPMPIAMFDKTQHWPGFTLVASQ